jgi:hypothetical protein
LSALYPARNYRQKTGTISGRVVAKDGVSQVMGINVIVRNVAEPFDAISRISGDRTQGLVGEDGTFEITGLTPGAKYVLYIDQIGAGGFSTPKAILLGPRGILERRRKQRRLVRRRLRRHEDRAQRRRNALPAHRDERHRSCSRVHLPAVLVAARPFR